MFSRRNQSSTEEEASDEDTTSSSVTSDATSRTTTSDSWYEAKSDIEQQSQRDAEKNQSARKVIKPQIDDDDDDDDDATDQDAGNNDTDHDEALIKAVNDIYINNDTHAKVENKLTTQNNLPIENKSKQETEKQEWVNPYWGPTSKTVITTTRTTVTEQIDSSNVPR